MEENKTNVARTPKAVRRPKCETGRACYEQAEARSTADLLNRSNARLPDRSNPNGVEAAHCEHCGCWHILPASPPPTWAPADASTAELDRRQRVVAALAKSNARAPRSRFKR